ncbi:hypothetical protein D7030_01310 [Flavobacteriaceae bacterium AU392]|nr:hypothetical protein D1817_07765 [Flavobacteriaceae bacterium]RKM86517.1 hypothetical protein D7030_01310 [Flavobacteriaceae bacterium AU392]
MIVLIKRNVKIFSFLFLIFIQSCYNDTKTQEINFEVNTDDYEIISKVIDNVGIRISPRNLSPISAKGRYSTKDSLEANKKMIDFVNKFRTIAIDTSLLYFIPEYEIITERYKTNNFNNLKLIDSINKVNPIDISYIKLKKVKQSIYFDSITYFNSSKHLKNGRYSNYIDIDYRFNFSNIVYNEVKNKAAIRCHYRYKDRYPEGGILFLEKVNNEWIIVDEHWFMPF